VNRPDRNPRAGPHFRAQDTLTGVVVHQRDELNSLGDADLLFEISVRSPPARSAHAQPWPTTA